MRISPLLGILVPFATTTAFRPLKTTAVSSITAKLPTVCKTSSFLSKSRRMASSAASSSTSAPPTKILTLLFVRRINDAGTKQILLGMKKRGFGQGKYNGFGGKVEPGETIEAAAIRELKEESCLTAGSVKLRGKITFTFLTLPDVLKVHVFEAKQVTGEAQETEEMKPQWFDEDKIPFDKMWADDEYWVPIYLQGKKFCGLFEFDDETTIISYKLSELKDDEVL